MISNLDRSQRLLVGHGALVLLAGFGAGFGFLFFLIGKIGYEGRPINHDGLLKYLISFRQHNEFHEQCVERIYCDIMAHCQPDKLTVCARYTRRGGLDINPFRSNFETPYGNNRQARQ